MTRFRDSIDYVRLTSHGPPPPHDLAINTAKIDKLLTLIEASTELNCLFLVLDNLTEIFKILPKICIEERWHSICHELLEPKNTCHTFLIPGIRNAYREICENIDQTEKLRNKSFFGLTSIAPLYSTLGFRPQYKQEYQQYFQLLAHTLLACKKLALEKLPTKLAQNRKEACLATIRAFALGKASEELRQLPEEFLQPDKYLSRLEEGPGSDRIKTIINFFKTTFVWSETARQSVSQAEFIRDSKPKKNKPVGSFNDMVDIEESDIPEWDPAINYGDDIDEDFHGYEIIFFHQTPQNIGNPEEKSAATRTLRKRVLENQLLPIAWSNLNHHDVTSLLEALTIHESAKENQESIAAKAQLALMFWTGMSEQRLARLTMSAQENISTSVDQFFPKNGILRLISDLPKLTDKKSRPQAHTRQQYIDLPLPLSADKALQDFIACTQIKEGDLFELNPQQIRNICLKKIRAIRKKTGARLTLGRIQTYMQNYLAGQINNDIAGASLTLGKKIYLGRTKIHYTSLDADYLTERYRCACQEINQLTGNNTHPYSEPFPTCGTKHLGTPYRPQMAALQTLFLKMSQDIIRRRDTVKTKRELVSFHNLFTAYSAWLVSLSTAHRDFKSPHIGEQQIDPETSFAVIRDKDSIDYYHSRLIWVSDHCRKQLTHYQFHLAAIRSLSKATDPENITTRDFFFLTTDLTPKAFSYSQLGKILSRFGYDLPLNSARHFLKSELQENGCPPDIIETFLGHWDMGQEPWVKTSALLPDEYASILKEHLPPVLKRAGAQPLAGLSKNKGPQLSAAVIKSIFSRPKKTKPRAVSSHDFCCNSEPGNIWYKIIAPPFQNKPFKEAFSREQRFVLQKLEKDFSPLFSGEKNLVISNKELQGLFKKLKPKPYDPKVFYKRVTFLQKGLTYGKEHCNWQVTIPSAPIISRKENNRVRPQLMKSLHHFRTIEKAFLEDLSKPHHKDIEIRIGQILLSAIFFGALGNESWSKPFIVGLAKDTYLKGDTLWIDLWTTPPKSPQERFYCQTMPNQYRRWVADPLTQLLLYRWLKESPADRKSCETLSPKTIITRYLQHLGMENPEQLATKVFRLASAKNTVTLPSYLATYAENQLDSVSLPDEIWLRFLTGINIPIALPKKVREVDPLIENFELLHQARHLRSILKILQQNQSKKGIEHYLADQNGKLCPALQLICFWSLSLLKPRLSYLESRKEKPLETISIRSYIGNIAMPLIHTFRQINPLTLDEEDLYTMYTRVIAAIKKQKSSRDKKSKLSLQQQTNYAIDRLKQFHEYLEAYNNLPHINFFALKGEKGHHKGHVSANMFPASSFEELLNNLGISHFDQTERLTRIVLIIAILTFRAGLRRTEVLGLKVEDFVSNKQIELLVRRHPERKLKSLHAQRRILLSNRLTATEIQFISHWLSLRKQELLPATSGFLLTATPTDNELITDEKPLNRLITELKQTYFDDTAVIHHARHTFANNTLLAFALRKDIEAGRLPAYIRQQTSDIRNILRNEPSGRKALFILATLLGHANPVTSLYSYVHICDWLLSYYLRHHSCSPKLAPRIITALLGCSTSRSYQILAKKHLLIKTLEHRGRQLSQLQHPLLTTQQKITLIPLSKPAPIEEKPFDLVVEKLKKNGIKLPKDQESRNEIFHIYEIVTRIKGKKRSKILRVSRLILGHHYKSHINSIEICKFVDARDIFTLLDQLGISTFDLSVSYHGSRFYNKKQQEKGLNQWREKFAIDLSIGPPCRLKNTYGCIRIRRRQNPRLLKIIFDLVITTLYDCVT